MRGLDRVTLANREYVEDLYRRYLADPTAVDEQWQTFFAGFDLALGGNGSTAAVAGVAEAASALAAEPPAPVIGVFDLVHSYRELGHLVAHLNPLGPRPTGHPLLDPTEFGFSDVDLDRVVETGSFAGCGTATLRELIQRLQDTYCRTVGVEYLHIQDRAQRRWLQERMEPTSNHPELGREDRIQVLDTIMFAEAFEQFLQTRYPTAKRFSLEGSEALITILDTLIEDAGGLGATGIQVCSGVAAAVRRMTFGIAIRRGATCRCTRCRGTTSGTTN